jgi:Carboxypeptidase regulatory-like domain
MLSVAAQLDGQLADASSAPISNTRLELRTYASEVKQVLFKRTQTDDKGNFSFGMTPAGRYRLVAFVPGFKQPTNLKCPNLKGCALSIRLEIASSDIPCVYK